MKKNALFLYLMISNLGFSQTDTLKNRYLSKTESTVLLVGYQFAPEAKDDTESFKSSNIHVIEVAYSNVTDFGGRHPASSNYYFGTDFIFNYNKFLLAPKAGINFSANGFSLGSEIQLQSDFKKILPRIMPYLGLGGNGFKMYLGYAFRLILTNYFPINNLNLGVTLPLYNFRNNTSIFSKKTKLSKIN